MDLFNRIVEPKNKIDLTTGTLYGDGLINSSKKLRALKNIFHDEIARSQMEQEQIIYEVQAHFPVKEGTKAGLFFGRTLIYPGKVGKEYFMTRGHFHLKSDRAEYYWGIQGEGMLLLMDRERNCWAEKMFPGSLHYIPGEVAHRTINTGKEKLIMGACWPSDAGHDYDEINNNGFSVRLMELDGKPTLIKI